MSDLHHSIAIARIESKRSVRRSFATRRKTVYTILFLAIFSPQFYLWGRFAYSTGGGLGSGGSIPLAAIGVQVVAVASIFVVFSAIRTVQTGRPEGFDLLLTSTSPQAIVLGTVIHQTVQLVTFVAGPILVIGGGFALGAGHPSIVFMTMLLLVPLFTFVTIFGTVLGQLFSIGVLSSALLRRTSQAIGAVVFLVIVALSFSLTYPAASGHNSPLMLLPLESVPLVHYSDLIFLGVEGVDAVSPSSIGSLVAVVVCLPVLLFVSARLAPRLWFADTTPQALLGGDAQPSSANRNASDSVQVPATHFPSRKGPAPVGIAHVMWTRWLRVPTRFGHVVPVSAVVVSGGISVFGDSSLLSILLPVTVSAIGVYLSGAVFCLNPIGNAGPMRVLETIAPMNSEAFLRGYAVAGISLGLPITLLGVGVFAYLHQSPLLVIASVSIVLLLVAGISAAVALLCGTIFPNPHPRPTIRGHSIAGPSALALIAHTFGTISIGALGAGPALYIAFTPTLRGYILPGTAASILALSLSGWTVYSLSVRRFTRATHSIGE